MKHAENTEVHDTVTLEQAAEWVVRLNDPSASEDDFLVWQAWLAEDASNLCAFHEMQEAWQRTSSVGSKISSAAADAGSTLPKPDHQAKQPRRWQLPLALAATLVLAFGIAFWRTTPLSLNTATAELRSVKLSDGSVISLGPETKLLVSYSDDARSIEMPGGEAYFQVARDPARPFSVKTRSGTVVAVGTAFSVRAVSERMSVAVTQGVVRVEPTNAGVPLSVGQEEEPGAQPVVLVTGQRLVREREHTVIAALPSLESAIAWQARRLEYDNEPLRVVVADINRYSDTKLHIQDAAVGDLRYTGTVFPDELEVWLTSIEGVFPVRVAASGANRIISSQQ